ncbi:MAG: helix-turn-helix domain-containing protein [Candidatus Pacebacteria bacterium]|nr:helix-turn-helix domain-containing protein [Candidatus Paceibacterota bacterium]
MSTHQHNPLQSLIQYGLTERQAKVYMVCLEFGVASIQQISKRLQVARSSCEATLGQLQAKGFISVHKNKTVRKYSPEDPKHVLKSAEQKVKALSSSLPDLTGIFLKNRTIPSVRMYEGKNGLWSVLEEILSEAKILYGFGSADALFDTIGETFPEFRRQRIQKKILIKIILKDSVKARQRQEAGPSELRDVRIIKDTGNFASLMFMWNSKIASFSLGDEIVAVIIESKEIAEGQMAMFNFTWNGLPAHRATNV